MKDKEANGATFQEILDWKEKAASKLPADLKDMMAKGEADPRGRFSWSFKIWVHKEFQSRIRLGMIFLSDKVKSGDTDLYIKGSPPQIGTEVEPTRLARMRELGLALDGATAILSDLVKGQDMESLYAIDAHFQDPQWLKVKDKTTSDNHTILTISGNDVLRWNQTILDDLGMGEGSEILNRGLLEREKKKQALSGS